MLQWFGDLDVTRFNSSEIDLNAPGRLSRHLLGKLMREVSGELDQQERLEKLGQLRLQFLADAAISASLVPFGDNQWVENLYQMLLSEAEDLGGPICTLGGDVHYMNIEGRLILMLPSITSANHAAQIVNSLSLIQDSHMGASCWVFDLSNLHTVPAALFAYLIGLTYGMRANQPRVALLWLRQDATPSELVPSVTKYFQLKKKGAFLLSRD